MVKLNNFKELFYIMKNNQETSIGGMGFESSDDKTLQELKELAQSQSKNLDVLETEEGDMPETNMETFSATEIRRIFALGDEKDLAKIYKKIKKFKDKKYARISDDDKGLAQKFCDNIFGGGAGVIKEIAIKKLEKIFDTQTSPELLQNQEKIQELKKKIRDAMTARYTVQINQPNQNDKEKEKLENEFNDLISGLDKTSDLQVLEDVLEGINNEPLANEQSVNQLSN